MQAVGSDDAISLWKIGLGLSEEFRELDVVFFLSGRVFCVCSMI